MLFDFGFFCLAFLTTIGGVEGWRRLALRQRILDVPNERSSHVEPTPRGGGLVIFAVTFVFLVVGAVQNWELSRSSPFLVGAALIAAVSWLDDLYSLPNWLRFGVHTVAALLVIFGIGYFKTIELPFYTLNLTGFFLGQVLTLLWIVGLTNAYNFMDGIDGIAGITGFIGGIGWVLAGYLIGDSFVFLFGGLLAATNLGFLWHNWQPARIFMGDVGSAFLGYSFAVLPLLATVHSGHNDGWIVFGVLVVWTFVFDSVLTFVRRAGRAENVFAAHRSHLYQRLVTAGYQHSHVSFLYGALSLIGLGLALSWVSFEDNILKLFVLIMLGIVFSGLWLFVIKSEKTSRKHAVK